MAENPLFIRRVPSEGFIDGYVPYLGVEEFNPRTHTEERDLVSASIKGVQVRRQKQALEAQFNLELDETGGM